MSDNIMIKSSAFLPLGSSIGYDLPILIKVNTLIFIGDSTVKNLNQKEEDQKSGSQELGINILFYARGDRGAIKYWKSFMKCLKHEKYPSTKMRKKRRRSTD